MTMYCAKVCPSRLYSTIGQSWCNVLQYYCYWTSFGCLEGCLIALSLWVAKFPLALGFPTMYRVQVRSKPFVLYKQALSVQCAPVLFLLDLFRLLGRLFDCSVALGCEVHFSVGFPHDVPRASPFKAVRTRTKIKSWVIKHNEKSLLPFELRSQSVAAGCAC